MNNITLSFIITTLAGLSTLLGIIPILFSLKNEEKIIIASLALAAGVMLSVSITDLLPESISLLKQQIPNISCCLISITFIILGILITTHIDKSIAKIEKINFLHKLGIISCIAIILHNIPEGIITFISTTKNTKLGISLAISIALHNIPEGITISIPIYYSTKSKRKAITYTLISALSEPLGAIITSLILLPYINNLILGILFSLITGIMLKISLTELLPTSYQYQNKKITNLFFIIGFSLMLINLII